MREPNASRNLRNASSTAASDVKSPPTLGIGTLCLEVEPNDPIVSTERLAERAAEVAGRAGDEDDRPQVCVCHRQIITGSRHPLRSPAEATLHTFLPPSAPGVHLAR